jgi:hypothetical protein
MKARAVACFVLCLCWALSAAVSAQPNSPDGLTYKTGYSSMMKLGRDIYNQLEKKPKDLVAAQPISLDVDMTPFVRMLYYPADDVGKPLRGVWISAGFIDLVNHVAHAAAIEKLDKKSKNYFKLYIDQLSKETGETELKPLPNDSNPLFWSEDMLNEQQGNFNSIVGIVVSIKLAHHYLGHFDKYKDKLTDANGNTLPINDFLTDKEWEDAYREGLFTSLNAGCFIEGVIPFYEAFDRMEPRPPWAVYFLPSKVKFGKTMKKDFTKFQEEYFAGRLKRKSLN